jgi:WhiB family transcriptional regulator, redox-sensing transcriptional regulator
MTAARDMTDWRSWGACLSADPDLFFPVSDTGASQRQEERAKATCARCPVQAECLRFALDTSQVHGVWGGLGERELAGLRGSRQAASSRLVASSRPPARIPGTGRVTRRCRPQRVPGHHAAAS